MAQSSNSGSDSPKSVTIRVGVVEFVSLLPCADLQMFVNKRLNELAEKDRQLSKAQAEIRDLKLSASKLTEDLKLLKEEELSSEINLIETKKQDLERAKSHRLSAFSDMFEAKLYLSVAMRKQRDLEAKLKQTQLEKAKLQNDNKELEDSIIRDGHQVEYLRNKNQELMKQLKICQDEKSFLVSLQSQKVAEAEKLKHTALELELETDFREVVYAKYKA